MPKRYVKPDGTLGVLLFLIVVGCAPFVVYGVAAYFQTVQLEQQFTGKLKQAADSNGIPLAQGKLAECIQWMEGNNLTEGSTHVWIKTPECDLGFFYQNLVSAKTDLDKFPPPPSEADTDAQAKYDLAESNQLMKLRETLVDEGESGPRVTCPPHLAYYPSQMAWWWLPGLTFLWGFAVAVYGTVHYRWPR